MRRIQMRRCFLGALWRHFCRRWLARNAPWSKPLLLDIILGFAREAIIELARLAEYQHFHAPCESNTTSGSFFGIAGRVKRKTVPPSGFGSYWSVPPWTSAIDWLIVRPRPMPSRLLIEMPRKGTGDFSRQSRTAGRHRT